MTLNNSWGTLNFYSLIDVKEASVDLADETLKFKGKSENKEYEVDIAFFKPVDSKGSTYKVLPRSVQMHVMKKDKEEEEFWPRLLKDKALEKNQVKIDWDRYVDEDEEEEGFDTSAVSSFYVFCWRIFGCAASRFLDSSLTMKYSPHELYSFFHSSTVEWTWVQ